MVFDEGREVWWVMIDGKKQEHASIKIVKAFIDRHNKNDFERIPIFMRDTGGGYYSYNRKDGPDYVKAVITSIGIDGTVFVVKEGEKHAEHMRYDLYVQNAKNEKLIAELEEITVQKKALDKKYQEKKEQLVEVDIEKLRKQVLGEKINNS